MHIGLIHNWPGSKNSELDLIQRIKLLLNRWGHEVSVLDPAGKKLDPVTGDHIEDSQLDPRQLHFVLYLHYLNTKLIDTFSYVVNWNPIKYLVFNPSSGEPLSRGEIEFVRNSLLSHDHMLSASSDQLDEFQYAQFGETRWAPRMDELKLHTSCQIFEDLQPIDLRSFKVFYIGANWEKITRMKFPASNAKVRHEGLLESLDATGNFVFYGIKEQHGIDLWEGFQNYQGELPFDAGDSIVRTCHKSGVALVLSSDAHRESAVVSTRIFQACAARCLVISDRNPFIENEFGDSVLYFDYEDDTASTVSSILTHLAWIKANPALAQKKAEASHKIFRDRFSLNAELQEILNHYHSNLSRLDAEYAKIQEHKVAAFLICRETDEEQETRLIISFLENLKRQNRVRAKAVLIVHPQKAKHTKAILCQYPEIENQVIADLDPSQHPAGTSFRNAFSQISDCTFFALWSSQIWWHQEHLANLVLESLNSGNPVVQSGTYIKNECFEAPFTDSYYLRYSTSAVPPLNLNELIRWDKTRIEFSSYLFSSKLIVQHWNHMSLLSLLDSYYPFILLAIAYTQTKKLPSYVPKFTCCHNMPKGLIGDLSSYPEPGIFFLAYENSDKFFSSDQQKSFLHGAMSANEHYRLVEGLQEMAPNNTAESGGSTNFSLNNYMTNILHQRPWLLKIWKQLFRFMMRFFKLQSSSNV